MKINALLLTCAAALAATVTSAQTQEPFRKCGTPDRLTQIAMGGAGLGPDAPADCSLFSTTIKAEYEPTFVYDIPVVFHVIQNTSGTGFIPMTEINEQIDVINEDFRAIAGSAGAPGTDVMLQFHLATTDPFGNPHSGVTYTTNNSWFNDSGTYWNSLNWDPDKYINVYTNSAGGFLGYVPWLPQGGSPGSNADRVVVLWSTVGKFAPIGAPYHLGRTLTHELGHYFGLEHTFDGGCGSATFCYTTGDLICDTNPEQSSTAGCPGSKATCGNPDPIHNYMDYSDDSCMWEFTPEQANRIRCTLENYRASLAGTPLPGVASNPSPAHAATNVSVNATLSWSAASGATSYDVYFGSDPTPDAGELVGNQAGLTFDPGTLAGSTTYYWRIDPANGGGTTIGPVWSFTTEAAGGNVTVSGISPSTIGALQVGSDQVVTISGSGFSPTTTVEVDGVPMFGIPSPVTIVNNSTITIDPPLQSTLGSKTITVKDGGSEDSTTLTYVANDPPALQIGTGDEPVSVFSFAGLDAICAGEPGDLFVLLGSVSNLPSSFPGIVELEIGNGLSSIFQLATATIPASGHVTIHLPVTVPSPLFTFYMEGVTVAPVPVFPVKDTNMQEVQVLF